MLELAILARRAHQRHFLAHVLVQQFRRLQQIVFIILFDHAQFVRLRQRPEMHRGRIHGSRNVRKFQAEHPARQRQLPHIPHQRDIRVINGDVQIGLIAERSRLSILLAAGFRFLLRAAVTAMPLGINPGTDTRTNQYGHRRCNQLPLKFTALGFHRITSLGIVVLP